MKLLFSWEKSDDGLSPNCSSDVVKRDGVSPLACLLTDDGGQRLVDTVPWLDEGIQRVKSVKYSRIDMTDWSRDTWGAELSKGEAKIYSLHDNDYFETLNLDAFEVALVAWRNFIQLTPELGLSQTLEV